MKRLVRAGADHFNFNAAVLGAAFSSFVVCNGLFLAFAFGVDTIRLNALGDQVSLDRFSAPYRQLLVVRVATDGVSVADGDDDFERDALEFAGQVVELGFGFRLQN